MKRFFLISLLAVAGAFSAAAQSKNSDHDYQARPQNIPAVDTTSVLCIGNSFTYFYNTDQMLLEIAASQGHCLKVKAATSGGYCFLCHLGDSKTIRAIENYNQYDVVILQNQSQLNAQIARNPRQYSQSVKAAADLAKFVRQFSPNAQLYFEASWASYSNTKHFKDFAEFDKYMMEGTRMLAKKNHAKVSPVCLAFSAARAKYPEINLLYKDRHHQSKAGSYLKSCVNYLLLFGGEFDSNVSDCTVDPVEAAKLREIALQIVNGK